MSESNCKATKADGASSDDRTEETTDQPEKQPESSESAMNPQFHVVLDLDGTTPPITVVSGQEESRYYDAIANRSKKIRDFRNEYKRPEEPPLGIPAQCRKQIYSCCPCDSRSQKKFLSKRFPVWRIMKKYKWRQDLPNDIVSGLTVGIMQLPQGMAYSLLAELPPVVGLYMAFFPVLIYFIFGSSRHISMGTVALCSLLTGSVISRFYNPALAASVLGSEATQNAVANMTSETDDPIEIELPDHVKISIAQSVCLLVGLVQTAMGFLNMGFITTYMSDPMIGGFTTGAAVHVGTSQVKYALGLKIPRSDGVFQIPKTYALIIEHISETSVPTVVMSAVCMVILYLVKVQVNQRFKSKMRFPVPVELIVVVAGTMLSYFMNFHEKYKMKIVGEIPPGLPKPSFPPLPNTSVYAADVFIIGIVAFSQCVSLAALFAKKHGYSYDANQELIAYGLGNIFGSFFSCYPYAASVSRSSVQESAGGRTQLASVVSATMVLIVIVSIGPLFESLPNCVLASIILVALRSLFLQFLDLPHIFKTSIYDGLIWIVTFLAVVVLHVDYGILLGMLFSFFTVVVRAQKTKAEGLQKIDEMHVYRDSSKYRQTQSVSGVKVVGFSSPLYYANGALYVKQVYTVTGVTPEKRRKQIKRLQKSQGGADSKNNFMPLVNETNEMGSRQSLDAKPDNDPMNNDWTNGGNKQTNIFTAITDGVLLHHVILDMSHVTFIDTVGSKVLKQLVTDYDDVKIRVLLSGLNDEVWRVLDVTDFIKDYEDRIYLTTDDAMNAVNLHRRLSSVSTMKYPPQRMMFRENSNNDAAETDQLLVDRESAF